MLCCFANFCDFEKWRPEVQPVEDTEPSLDELRAAVQLACQPTHVGRIVAGRARVLAMPREWVLSRIELLAVEALNLSDDWEYRRLLELADSLDPGLVRRLQPIGLASGNPHVREAAEDFQAMLAERDVAPDPRRDDGLSGA